VIDRRTFLAGTGAVLLAAPLTAEAQPTKKVWRIGFLSAGSSSANLAVTGPFRQGLHDLGYVEGRDFVMENRWAEGHADQWPVKNTRRAFEAAVKVANLNSPLRFHDCRHHFASWFVMDGGSVTALQQILGHSTLAMTMRYAHLSPGCLRDEMAKTDRSLEPPAGTRGRSPWEPLGSGAAPLVFLHQ